MASAENTKKTIESIFEEFYLIVMKDHYMASFINSHQFMERLIQSQSHFLYRALFELDPEEVYEEYYKIGAIHWKIRLDEGYLFKMLNFIEEQLADKIRNQQIALSFDKLEEVFNKIRNSTGFAYIFGNLDDTIYDLRPVSQEGQYLITNIKRFRNHLLKVHNWGSLTYDDDCEPFISDFTTAELGKALATIAFRIKSYSNRKQQLQIESLNKSIHQKAELSIKYYELGNYTQTLLMVKHLVNDATLLVTLLEQHEHYWQTNKHNIIIGFLTEKSNEGGLFSITTNSADVNGAQLNKSLIQQIKNQIKTQLNGYCNVFAYDMEETLYIYSEQQSEHKIDLMASISEIANSFVKKNKVSITEALLNIGYINTKYLQNLTAEEMQETIRVMENRTEQLPNTSHEIINSVNFGKNIYQIIDEIKQNLCLKEVVTEAIAKQDIDLHFHTIVHVSTTKTFGAESLVRIKQGNEIIPAGRFIEIINDYDLSLQLDLAVLTRLIRDIKEISQKIKTLFVNVNPESIKSEQAIQLLKKLIKNGADNGLRIVLELTEYSLTSELDSLKQLQDDNFGIAVDDFGTGYTNFEIVKTLKDQGLIQVLKVDGSLVKSINDSETSQSLLEAIILLGTKLGLDLVLEYIEDQSIVKKLQEINQGLETAGIVFGQGWHYSRPQPIGKLKIAS
ncbi:EAL domain-containing protein [Thiomicrorhabdus sp. 6S2-11]|uniref:EAL domain-containing protein n=1 Tax=Thiomicrorhabdus marina TaxID=2818442 RepID=A0ABS3Q5U0_9GAMM|nr:EAL domain-containing protein [Thiomicrorhabdus marina]MBO1927703.1 EAL domain-containing protein [Thiomicrorhabdus marina]